MLKKIFIASLLAVVPLSTFAAVVAPPLYHVEIRETDGVVDKSVVSFTTFIGKVMPIEVTQENKENSTNCSISLKDNQEITELNVEQKNSIGITATVYTMSIDGDNVKTMLTYSKQDDVSSDKAIALSETCHFANAVSTTTNLQWLGNVKLNEKTKIPVTGKNNLFIIIKKVTPSDKY